MADKKLESITFPDLPDRYVVKPDIADVTGLQTALDGKADTSTIAPDYDSTKTYAVSDYVYYNGDLYRCTTAITTAEAWTAGHWMPVALANDVDELNSYFEIIPTTKNLYSGKNEQEGYLKNGVVTAHNNWMTTDYIYVGGLTSIVASSARNNPSYPRGNANLYYLTTYDEDKDYIETKSTYSTNTYTIESGVAYIRFSHNKTGDVDDIMVESGTTYEQSYTPYVPSAKIPSSGYASDKELKSAEKEINIVKLKVDSINTFEVETTDLAFTEQADGYIKNTGALATASGNNYYGSGYVEISEGEDYWITASANYGHALYCFYDSNHNVVLLGDLASSAGTATTITKKFVTAPGGAKYVAIAYIGTGTGAVGERDGYNFIYQPWIGKKWTCVGDSLTATNVRTTKHYFDYVAEATGITTVNMGDGGSGYAKEQDVNTAFYQRVANVPLDSDVVTIFGSFNDGSAGLQLGTATDSGTTTIAGCMNETFDNLFTAFPLANLGVVTPTPWIDAYPLAPSDWGNRYVELLMQICENRGIPCLDLYNCSGLRPWEASYRLLAYSKDEGNGVHPDETGHAIIAPRFKAFLETLLL